MSLISASRLRAFVSSVILLDARPGPVDYASGHLPGAHHADLNRDLSTAADADHDPARGGRHPLPTVARFAAQVAAWGITPTSQVAIYDASGGGNAAARLWWMLRALGHRQVLVLDGGLAAALAEGLTLSTDCPAPATLPPYPAMDWTQPQVDVEAVETLRQDPAWKLLDVRSAERWRGDTEPFDPVAGHIPGSLSLAWNESLAPDGRFKAPERLRAQFLALLADTPPERLAVHCGSGVTACQTLLALEVAGLPGASVYMGSWSEWCRSGRDRIPG